MKEMDWEWARLADQVPTRRLKLREEEAPAELVCRKGRSLCAFCIDDGGKEGGQPFFCPKKRTDSVSDDRPPCPRCQSWAENRSITGSLTHSRLHFPHLHPPPLVIWRNEEGKISLYYRPMYRGKVHAKVSSVLRTSPHRVNS